MMASSKPFQVCRRYNQYSQAQKRARCFNGGFVRGQNDSYNVVVTGGTKGIGYALANKFLEKGDNVLICSRSEERVLKAVQQLRQQYGQDRVFGRKCNVSKVAEVRQLAKFGVDCLGRLDIWINNAGTNAYSYSTLEESDDDDIMNIVTTNVLGVIYGCREAISIMKNQKSGGHVFNMDGAGADGGPTPRVATYGATKRGVNQLSKSIEAELKMLNIQKVGVHNLSPGMVSTELLMSCADSKESKFFINCVAEPPETVAESLVPQIRSVPQESETLQGGVASGTYIRFISRPQIYGRILMRVLFGKNKDRFVAED
eukprot:TRINITY_DN3579_c0_g1_i4.p1 TRINITY_DN3579_c0_g1~~TRINITY_DN3579_c0_g1_i4.p1  ORF type:complete len:315 (-),score=50.93 TRINITY_DN3579_c0_g1_i4:464-1408(-)